MDDLCNCSNNWTGKWSNFAKETSKWFQWLSASKAYEWLSFLTLQLLIGGIGMEMLSMTFLICNKWSQKMWSWSPKENRSWSHTERSNRLKIHDHVILHQFLEKDKLLSNVWTWLKNTYYQHRLHNQGLHNEWPKIFSIHHNQYLAKYTTMKKCGWRK